MMGGMSELARCLGRELARRDAVEVFSAPGHRIPDGTSRAGALSRRPWRALDALQAAEHSIDLWLAMNAGLLPLARHLERPLVAYVHGNDFLQPWLACGPRWLEALRRPVAPRLRLPLRRRALAAALPHVAAVLTNSRQTKERFIAALGGPAQQVAVHPPGVDDVFFQPLEPAAERNRGDTLHLLTVSRLSRHTRRKNVDGVLEALALLARDDSAPRIRYDVVGDGDDRARLEALAAALELDASVRFLGAVARDELLAAYRRADLFVLASRATSDDVEGFGIVYMEASAAGTPVLASRAGGAIDAVDEGHNGFLVDASDPTTLADAFRRFAAERSRYSPETTRAVAERYRWPSVAAAIREDLLTVL